MAGKGGGNTRMYFFKGRTTGVAAKSADEARERKTRGSDVLKGFRAAIPGEFGPDGKRWSRLRLDGKPPGKSKHDGRGLGPAPKKK